MKHDLWTWCGIVMALLLAAAARGAEEKGVPVPQVQRPVFQVVRFETNPIIRPGMPGLEGADGANINGPSLIRVPAWADKPLGKYYLYFAHHGGKYIRLAYATALRARGRSTRGACWR